MSGKNRKFRSAEMLLLTILCQCYSSYTS